jgi:chromate transporter
VLWPQGLGGHFEWMSALIGLGAAAALFRFKVGVISVVVGAGVAGLLVHLGRSLLTAAG